MQTPKKKSWSFSLLLILKYHFLIKDQQEKRGARISSNNKKDQTDAEAGRSQLTAG